MSRAEDLRFSSETICAVATSATANAGISIIRMSGEDAPAIARRIFQCKSLEGEFIPGQMYLGRVDGGVFKEKAFCVFHKRPRSYTGEDVIELHCHGGRGVTAAILRLMVECGARPAHAGEFTKRAFLNGKMSLDEAEGIADLINAESQSDIANAYRLMNGEIGKGLAQAERMLTESAAMLEAMLDYPEELEEETREPARELLIASKRDIEGILATARHTKTLKSGINIAIIGAPNVGKSSLLNALVREDRAIVTPIAGTTRDVLCESVEIEGIRLNFLDTAGIRETDNVIEEMGIERAKRAVEGADVVIYVQDASVEGEQEYDFEGLLKGKRVVYVSNKTDIKKTAKRGIEISARTGFNVQRIIDEIMQNAERGEIYARGIVTNERHIFALKVALESINSALEGYDSQPCECSVADINNALFELGKISGRNVSEAVIDEIFNRFCVGK